jgi:hypothetical protein
MKFPEKFPEETTNPIYTEFFSKSKLEAKVEKTKWRNQPSKNSFCFINPEVKYNEREGVVLKKLKEVFGIDSNTFDTKFRQAISGDGQEVKRISTLHSSSLAALLLLYSVSENELECTLDGENYTFNDCFFEVKTNVKDSHFSNMDVVLVGKDSKDIDVIFFLESKFSEYLNTGMCNNISIDAYKKSYDELGLIGDNAIKGLLIQEGIGTDNLTCLQIMSTREPQYCSGIKQMISHYMGVINFIEQGKNALDPKQKSHLDEIVDLRNRAGIILGEVLFDFGDTVDEGASKLSRYSTIYNKLATILNKHTSKLYILPKILTYQELLKDFKLDKKVKDFYQL